MDEEVVVLDYYHTTVYPTEYEKTVDNGGYIKMPYLHAKGDSQPNMIYGGRKYKTEQLFITKASSPDYDGELVIKHAPITNGDVSVYLVIPLKTRPTIYEETAIDKIINKVNTSAFEFHLGELIGYNQTCKVNKDATVFILSPMLVKSSFDAFATMRKNEWNTNGDFRKIKLMFSGSRNPIRSHDGDGGVEGFREGYELYDCEPVIENDGKNKPTVEVMPITSELAKNMGTMNVMNATIHFFTFLIMIIISAVITPIGYKTIFIDFIKDLGVSNADDKATPASLKMLDYIGSLILILFSIGISMGGISAGDPIQTSIGVFASIFILISICVVSYYKTTAPGEYAFGATDVNLSDSNFGPKLWERILNNKNWGLMMVFEGIIIAVFFVITLFTTFDKNKKKDKSKKKFVMWYAAIFGSIFSIYVVCRLKTPNVDLIKGTATAFKTGKIVPLNDATANATAITGTNTQTSTNGIGTKIVDTLASMSNVASNMIRGNKVSPL